MARVTVEDCVTIIPNRFELVLLASQRARDIAAGVDLTVDRDNDKNAVVALREIADQTLDFSEIRRHIVRGVNRHADLNLEDDALLSLTQEMGVEDMDLGGASEIEEISFESDEENTEGASEDAMEAAEAAFSSEGMEDVDVDADVNLEAELSEED